MPTKKPLTFTVSRTGCFEVNSHYKNVQGYAIVSIDNHHILAHRHIWTECFGAIPENFGVCHKCDNPNCINPEHLFLGTHADNTHDMIKKGRQVHACGEAHGRAKLTIKEVTEIRSRYRAYDRRNGARALAREFGVYYQTIHSIEKGNTWAAAIEGALEARR
jgi:hypothetical protein